IHFDRSNNFSGGIEGARTVAYHLVIARSKKKGPVAFEVSCEASVIAAARIENLDTLPSRSPDQESEYRHMLKVRDGNIERIQTFTKCLKLAVNNKNLRKNTWLNDEDELTNFLLGLRDITFGLGTPILLDDNSSWLQEVMARKHHWCVWWREDKSIYATVWVDDQELAYAQRYYRSGKDDSIVFGERSAFELFVLRIESFYRVALPVVTRLIVERWGVRAAPATALDLRRWAFSACTPDKVANSLDW